MNTLLLGQPTCNLTPDRERVIVTSPKPALLRSRYITYLTHYLFLGQVLKLLFDLPPPQGLQGLEVLQAGRAAEVRELEHLDVCQDLLEGGPGGVVSVPAGWRGGNLKMNNLFQGNTFLYSIA